MFVEGYVPCYGDDAVPLHVSFITGFPSIMVNGLHIRMSLFLLILLFANSNTATFYLFIYFYEILKPFSILHWCVKHVKYCIISVDLSKIVFQN